MDKSPELVLTKEQCDTLDNVHIALKNDGVELEKIKQTLDSVERVCYRVQVSWLKQFLRVYEIDYPRFLEKYSGSGMYLAIPLKYISVEGMKQKLNIMKAKIMASKSLKMKTIKTGKLPKELVPKKNPTYVPFGVHDEIKKILNTSAFLPLYISGLSGCGKTETIKQVCNELGRELVVLNITKETDESDVIGHYTLKDGETVWVDGPAIMAMKRGAVLLLDEVDLAGPKLMCLQSIVNGDGYYVKKQQEMVYPKTGFMVLATANTKGRGDGTGSFIGANVQNEAALDRYSFSYVQDYPEKSLESQILMNNMVEFTTLNSVDSIEDVDKRFISNLIDLAEHTREAYGQEQLEHVLTTRRLISVIKYYIISDRDVKKSITVGLERFDDDTIKTINDMKDKHWRDIHDDSLWEDSDIEFTNDLYDGEEPEGDDFDPSEYQDLGEILA